MAQLELDDFYDLSTPQQVAVSPDGDRVAFVTQEFDPDEDQSRTSLFVVPTDGSRDPHRLTRASDAGMPTWSPDGRYLGFIAARDSDVERSVGRDDDDESDDTDKSEGEATDDTSEEDGDEDDVADTDGKNGNDGPKPQVWAFDMELGGDAIQLTDSDEGVREFDWGPNSERLVVSARDPTDDEQEMLDQRRDDGPIEIERLQHKADGQGWLDDVTTYLFVVDIDTGDKQRLDDAFGQGAREPLFGLQPAWGHSGRIAFGSNRTENPDDSGVIDLYTIDPDGNNIRKLTDSTRQVYGYEWSPNGERLAFVSGDPNNWYKPGQLCVANPDGTESPPLRSVTDSLDRTIAMPPSWLSADQILLSIGDEGHTRFVRVSATEDTPDQTFPALTRDRTLGFSDAAGGTVATVISDPQAGSDVFALEATDLDDEDPDSLTCLSELNAGLLDGLEMPDCRRVTTENSDGIEVEAITYLPPDFDPETDGPRPVIASIHGGPMAYDAPTFQFAFTYWTNKGYVVYRPNYRGSTSYGQEFAETLKGTRGDLETDDVVSLLDELADRGWVDDERSLVTGFSYGGITTANVVTRSDRFAAAGAEHGIYDFRSTFGTDDNHLWHDWEFGLPWEEPELFEEISSITDVDQIETPLLVNAGENDWRCPPTQAEQLYVSVRKQGVPAKLVIYQDEHHNISTPDRAIHRLESLTEWFQEHDPGSEVGDEE
ncbi:S9 family peptidase [Halovenus rubra]|uniref:S9 family peptidase n=2 Tax=Halovenus rubra TaxID=869890 RepID=A0ABD5XB87_9EURY|nr:S9 family peptidase [Halovenus rubra]